MKSIIRIVIILAGIMLFSVMQEALAAEPENYLYLSSGELASFTGLLARSADITGVQVVYSWKQLELSEGVYDFSAIERDLHLLTRLHKKLFIQIQDRFFEPDRKGIPGYLLREPQYQGGLVVQTDNPGEGKPVVSGWVAIQWNKALRGRYRQLLSALASRFDGKVAGVNLPETAIDVDEKNAAGFTCDRYFAATMENAQYARKVFRQTAVVQYVNFWPCEWNNDHRYMSRFFEMAAHNKIGLGGPDIVPDKPAHMHNAYPFFHQYKNKLHLVAMAVQEPTLTYTSPRTGKPYTRDEFRSFAKNYLGADIIFWSPRIMWAGRSTPEK